MVFLVETSHVDNFGDAYRMVAYATCPRDVYETQWATTMGAWKFVPKKGLPIFQHEASGDLRGIAAQAAPPARTTGGYTGTSTQVGSVFAGSSWPLTAAENVHATDFRGDGKTGVTVSIPLSELLGEFNTGQLAQATAQAVC